MSYEEDVSEEKSLVEQLKNKLKMQQDQLAQETQRVDQSDEEDSFVDLDFQLEIDEMIEQYDTKYPAEVLKENINILHENFGDTLRGQNLGVGTVKTKNIESKAHQILENRFKRLEDAVKKYKSQDELIESISGLSKYITKDEVTTRDVIINLNFSDDQLELYLKALMLYDELSQNSD